MSRRSQEKSHNPKASGPFDFGILSLRDAGSTETGSNSSPPSGAVMESDLGRWKSRRTEMSFDKATGRWCAKLGRKQTKSGNIDGHKFRFTSDVKESERRKLRIQQLWDRLVEQHGSGYTWSDRDLAVALAMVEGKSEVSFSVEQLAPRDEVRRQLLRFRSQPRLYAKELAQLQSLYPEVTIVPDDPPLADIGRKELTAGAEATLAFERQFLLEGDHPSPASPGEPSVAKALDAYEAHVKAKMLVLPDDEEGLEGRRLSDTGQSYLKQIGQIRAHNVEQLAWPLSRLTFQGCDAMLEVWRQRPPKKDESGPMAIKTCREHAKLVKRFFRWLSKSDDFDWTKPHDFDELPLEIHRTNLDKSAPITVGARKVKTYTVEELVVLNQYAIPIERFLLLCGLNLGFKRMECATLRVGEIHLRTLHDYAKYINFGFSTGDSFVRRLRTKTEVYGEWILWPLTVKALEWVLNRRRHQTHITKGDGMGREIPFSPTSLVLLNDYGHSFTKPTESGNPNHQITAAWTRLLTRIRKDKGMADFPWLPHESLRDTASDWIREEFGGEIADVFLAHGSPLGANSLVECYTNKPFGRLFKALQWLETKLKPMFDSTPPSPFPEERKKRIGGLSVRQKAVIRDLSRQKISVQTIAAKAGCSVMSVYRYREDDTGNDGAGSSDQPAAET